MGLPHGLSVSSRRGRPAVRNLKKYAVTLLLGDYSLRIKHLVKIVQPDLFANLLFLRICYNRQCVHLLFILYLSQIR